MESYTDKLNSNMEESKETMIAKYGDLNIDNRTIELDILQVGLLNKILSSHGFRFQTEDFAKIKLNKLKRQLSIQKSSAMSLKSLQNESFSEVSEDQSSKQAKRQKIQNKAKVEPKETAVISEEMKQYIQLINKAKQETQVKLRNLYSEIDFELVENGIYSNKINTLENYQDAVKQAFKIVLTKYDNVPSLHKILTNIMMSWMSKNIQEEIQEKPIEVKSEKAKIIKKPSEKSDKNSAEKEKKPKKKVNNEEIKESNNSKAPHQNGETPAQNSNIDKPKAGQINEIANSDKRWVSRLDRKELRKKINKLDPIGLKGVIAILKRVQMPKDGTIECDINKLDEPIVLELMDYVNEYINKASADSKPNPEEVNSLQIDPAQGVKGSQSSNKLD